ncbi:MAG: SMP-30/gluconolactonase/LRE family protein [Ancalomicrobiaceae bacterium]|nr:SMP-30/gluconolactonase/LRE family protein [Ancalomicrobiaceae bacterium]
MDTKVIAVVEAANVLGEGVVWDGVEERVLWTDIEGRALWSYDPATGNAVSRGLPDRLACFAPLAGGRIAAGFVGGVRRYDPRSGVGSEFVPVEADEPATRVNDGKLDRAGRLVFGTMDEGNGETQPIGGVWTWDGMRTPRKLFGGIIVSNSIAFSPEGDRMYFADSPTRTIWVFDYDVIAGEPSNRRVFAQTTAGYPDGSCVDADGCLWNAEWEGGCITRYTPDGRVDRRIALPVSRPTCPAFGGPDQDTLYITSARRGFDEARLAAEPLAGSLLALRPGVSGLEDARFAGE